MKRRNMAFKFSPDLNKAYRQLFGPSSPAGCSVCNEDQPELLDIHKSKDSDDYKVLCFRCQNHEQTYKLNSVKNLKFQGGVS